MSSELSTLALKMPSRGNGRFSGKDHKLQEALAVSPQAEHVLNREAEQICKGLGG